MIYETCVDGVTVFSASAYGTWLPGVYETANATRYAFRLTPSQVADLASNNKVITLEEMKRIKNENR